MFIFLKKLLLWTLIAFFIGALLLFVGLKVYLPKDFGFSYPNIIKSVFGADVDAEDLQQRIQLPPGFSISLYAQGLTNARMLRVSDTGDLLVSQPRSGIITLLKRDRDGDGRPDGRVVLAEGLKAPHGLDFYRQWLYIAESDGVGRIEFDHQRGETIGSYQRIITGLSSQGNHWTKTLRFGADGLLYIASGSSCNVCEETNPQRAAMSRYQPDGSDLEIIALGLRNSVGFAWSSADGQLYATDNGRDLLGDDFPPDELNQIVVGKHYGWPYANGNKIGDPDYGAGNEDIIANSDSPVHDFRPHNAPLGINFIKGDGLPEAYHHAALVALHGSWNRSVKDGYKVVSLHWGAQGEIEERDFVAGFLQNDEVIGRPVDVIEGIDGEIYISDDFSGSIYRVTYRNGGQEFTSVNEVAESSSLNLASQKIHGDSLADLDPKNLALLKQQGALLYETFECASCHVEVGMLSLRKVADRYDLEKLQTFFDAPTSPMPRFELNAEEKEALAVYVLTVYP